MAKTAYGQNHLPGYLPEKDKKEIEEKTLARMKIPFSKIPFIKHVFGDRIVGRENGSLLECLYKAVEVLVDPAKNICRLSVLKWKKLEELNLHSVSL